MDAGTRDRASAQGVASRSKGASPVHRFGGEVEAGNVFPRFLMTPPVGRCLALDTDNNL
jgi:hypothetical protein